MLAKWLYRIEDVEQASVDRAERRFKYSIVAGKEVFWSFHQVMFATALIEGIAGIEGNAWALLGLLPVEIFWSFD